MINEILIIVMVDIELTIYIMSTDTSTVQKSYICGYRGAVVTICNILVFENNQKIQEILTSIKKMASL